MKTAKRVEALVTSSVITLIIDGNTAMIRKGDSQFQPVLDCIINNKLKSIPNLLLSPTNLKKISYGIITIEGGEVLYKSKPVNNAVVVRIKEFLANGLPIEPLIKFLKKLLSNPSPSAIEQLYNFLEHRNMPITQEGNFLAYKKVTKDYKDFHSGKFDNRPGQVLKMLRVGVDANPDNYCSNGFHVGSLNYADVEFHSGDGRIVIVEVNPQHAVSVPKDHSGQKLRTWMYTVISDYDGPLEQAKVIMSKLIKQAIAKIEQLRKSKKGRAYVAAAIEKMEEGLVDKLSQLTSNQISRKQAEAIAWMQAS